MSTFIDKNDYDVSINSNVLDQITQFDDQKLDRAEATAISKVKGYLATRYDTTVIFAATGSARHPMVLDCCVKICLFEIHMLINPRKVPEYRKESYERAIGWLELVMEGKVEPPDLPRLTSPDGDYIKFGSNPIKDTRF